MAKGKVGRPTVMTPEVLAKLKQAFLYGSNDKEAYHYAEISHETFYNYIEKHPEFREQITSWQDEPILKARKKIVDDIETDTNTAKWYLERKVKSEFSLRQELTGKDGESLPTPILGGLSKQSEKPDAKD
jgi:hypothetical protein